MTPILIIAVNELREGLRNRWVVAATLLLAALALALAFLGSAPVGAVAASPLAVTVASLASLTVFLIPLIALLLSFDAVVGEAERGTLLLLLTYPLSRWQILAGKYLGQLAVLGLATVLGYGLAGAVIALSGETAAGWQSYAVMVAASVLLGAAFLALGLLISIVVPARATAAGLAVAVWLLLVVLYDLGLLALLTATEGQGISPALVGGLLLANPADAYRLYTLAGLGEVARYTGLAGLGEQLAFPAGLALAALFAWVLLPLLLAGLIFSRRQG